MSMLLLQRLLLPAACSLLPMAVSFAALADPPALPVPNPKRAAAAAPQSEPAAAPADNRPTLTEAEAQHVKRFDAAIAPTRDTALPAEMLMRVRDAAAAIAAGDLAKGTELHGQVTDAAGRKLIDWFRLRAGYGGPAEYRAFLADNPAWPDRTLLTQRFEEALFTQGGSSAAIKDHFKVEEPKTAAGWAALASAHLIDGDANRARTLAARAWREPGLAATLETGFLERFGTLLTEADHKRRLDRLLIDDVRWAGERNERVPVIRRVIPLLSKAEQQKAEARLAVFQQAGNAARLMSALPADTQTDWGLAFHRIQLLRRSNKDEEAHKLLQSAPADRELLVNPDAWWVERRANAYAALNAGKPRMAYDVVREAGPLSANPLKDQAYLAGWLALRTLNDAKRAEEHFLTLQQSADGPLSRARAEYWLGRTREALGDRAKAEAHYKAGAVHIDTFYGQLAREKLNPRSRRIDLKPPLQPTAEETQRFNALDAAKAAVIARKAGLETGIVRAFLSHLARTLKSEGEVAMTAHLAEALGDTQFAVRIGKLGIARGLNLVYYAYPIHAFPAYKPLRQPPETALLLAIARQESEFNGLTVSGAGARGILQVMPVTARHVCKDYKVKCDIGRLLTDASYNTMMASAYIGDRANEFAGSYVLTFSGYNAGPGRTRQWIRAFGDPRDPKVDALDWITRIPFEETREYVQKVLSNVQVYRARLGQEATALQIGDDLARAKGKAGPVAAPTSTDAWGKEPDGTASDESGAVPTVAPKGANGSKG